MKRLQPLIGWPGGSAQSLRRPEGARYVGHRLGWHPGRDRGEDLPMRPARRARRHRQRRAATVLVDSTAFLQGFIGWERPQRGAGRRM